MNKFHHFLIVFCCLAGPVLGQKTFPIEFKPGQQVEEYTPEKSGIHRELPAGYSQRILEEAKNRSGLASFATQGAQSTTQVIVSYETPPPANVKAVFEKAATVWANTLTSDVPIQIYVRWRSLATGVLGSAGAGTATRNFAGANRLNTWYPIALAEKMAHRNLNGTDPDIVATFNSDFSDWYIGTEGVPTFNQIDLFSVVLHEFGHGLGFIGEMGLSDDLSQGQYGLPGIFDQFVQTAAGVSVTDTLKMANPSLALKTAITSTNLQLTSPKILQNNGGTYAKLYSPRTYSAGSSIYHVDQATYKVGDPNALMTPQIARGEVTPQIGPIVSSAFADFGWYSTNIIASDLPDTENTSSDISISATVYSDTLVAENSVKLMLSINKSILSASSMPLTKTGNTYTYKLPAASGTRTISYYWMANEASGKKVTTPAEAPVIANTNFGSYYGFTIGADTVKPKVVYANRLNYIFASQTSIPLSTLSASDNIGLSAVYMEYAINNGSFKRKDFQLVAGTSFTYSNAFVFAPGEIKSGDVIRYRVVVQDAAKALNTTTSPSSGYYSINVLALQAVETTYMQTFDTNVPDFYLKGMSIGKAVGFTTAALQTAHPYADGSEESYDGGTGTDRFTNSDAVLLKPIKLNPIKSILSFDEIVLVEPGDTGEAFLNSDGTVNRSFFDYVIVQGSKDGGLTWSNFTDGWDSNANSAWLKAWNSSVDTEGNSTALPTAALIKNRQINLLGSGKFNPGDQVLIRFRLHADVGAHGWGWSVDNLKIQEPVLPIDVDKDGVDDSVDLCLNTAAGAKVDANGCSEAQKCAVYNVPFLVRKSDQVLSVTSEYPNVTYIWLKNGNVIQGQTGATYTTTEPGTYTVKAQVTAVCVTGESNAINIIVLGNEPNAIAAGMTLTPNPSSGRVRVQANFQTEETSASLRVYDMQGKPVMGMEVTPLNGQMDQMLDLSNQAAGSYIIEVRSENRLMNRRVILLK
jgi:hypothetical protein